MYNQKLKQMICNPVTGDIVAELRHWIHSSTRDYHRDRKGISDIEFWILIYSAKKSNKETQDGPGSYRILRLMYE